MNDGVGFLLPRFVSGFRFSLHQPVLHKRPVLCVEHCRKLFMKSRLRKRCSVMYMELLHVLVRRA